MRATSPRSRTGFTLVEGLVALGLMALFGTVLWNLSSGGARQGAHAEQTSSIVRAGTLLHTALGVDLLESLPLEVLPEGDRLLGEDLTRITLPRFESYHPTESPALRYRPRVYRWDPDRGRLLRDGKPLAAGLIRGIHFRWTEEEPRELLVALEGDGLEGRTRVLQLSFPAPTGTGGSGFYRRAGWHQGGVAVAVP